jgi:hypothetical protein
MKRNGKWITVYSEPFGFIGCVKGFFGRRGDVTLQDVNLPLESGISGKEITEPCEEAEIE